MRHYYMKRFTDDMLKAKSARVSEYLFLDLRRPAPHLRRPDVQGKQMRMADLKGYVKMSWPGVTRTGRK